VKRATDHNSPMPSGYPPISAASTEFGTRPFSDVLYAARRYDHAGIPEYLLVQDPTSWKFEERKPGVFYAVRPTPKTFTGERFTENEIQDGLEF